MKQHPALAALIVFASALAFGQQSADRDAYEQISKRIFARSPKGLHSDFELPSGEERAAARKALREIVARTIVRAAEERGATSESILKAILDLQHDDEWERRPGEPSVPFVQLQTLRALPTMTTAFAVLSGGRGIPEVSAHIQFYSKLGGRWELVAETGEDFKDRVFAVAPLSSPIEGQEWYLAWGMVIGDTGARLRLRLYAFDGFSLRTVWARDGLRGGGVKIESDGSVTLKYFEHPPDGQPVPPIKIIQRLRMTLKGLEP